MGRIGTIINRKGKQDQRKAKVFTKLARYIMVAAREGGGDPQYNAALMSAIDKAKSVNMPNDNIERAIKKGTGDIDGVVYTKLTYEGYGPSGIAVLVECLTDNLNRTASDVRSYFSKCGGNLGTNGCVSYLFDYRGVLLLKVSQINQMDEFELSLMDLGVEDFSIEDEYVEIYTKPADLANIKNTLVNDGYVLDMAELRYLPQNLTVLTDESAIKNMEKLLDLLEDNDDVQNVYHNWLEE